MQFKTVSQAKNSVWKNVIHCEVVKNYASGIGAKWGFIVEMTPWMGCFYERLIGLVKRAVRKTIGRNLLTLIQMQSLIKEVEAVLNSRPLVYVGDDINSRVTLTPGHFYSFNARTCFPETIQNPAVYLSDARVIFSYHGSPTTINKL